MIIITPNCNIHDSTLGFPVSWALETIRVHSVVYLPQHPDSELFGDGNRTSCIIAGHIGQSRQ